MHFQDVGGLHTRIQFAIVYLVPNNVILLALACLYQQSNPFYHCLIWATHGSLIIQNFC